MSKSEVLALCANGHRFLAPDALEYILSKDDPVAFINLVLKRVLSDKLFLSKGDVVDAITGDAKLFTAMKEIKAQPRTISDIRIFKESDITGESKSEGNFDDFVKYFSSRFQMIKRMIERRIDFQKSIDISMAKSYKSLDREYKIIGMVDEVARTRNGHTMVDIADMTDNVKVMVLKDSPLRNTSFVKDEVVGFIGKFNRDFSLFFPSRIVRPDISKSNKWEASDTSSKVAFVSDIHIGSKTFMESGWKRMISWLKSNQEKECINYLVFPGDVVDGIGIYPGQEQELDELNIYHQYEMLAECLKEIPDEIKMVLHPGNHDACRLAEPQPALNSIFTKGFDSNIALVGNPITFEIEGRIITSYHGKSFDDWIPSIQRLSYDTPIESMKEMCMRRHVAPIYGGKNAISPENKDYLVMERLPNIFVTGHIHKVGQGIYNGVRLLNASTFQNQTPFQKQHNFNPTPCVFPTIDLSNGLIKMHNFNI